MVCDLNYHQIKPPKILKDSKNKIKGPQNLTTQRSIIELF